ncbi:MAG: DMT family transporter [Bacteroidales bacterium]|nr:DMT family transporter [Bacteroidales bacterium]
MKNQQKAYFFALVTVMLWSTMSTAFKLTLGLIRFDNLLFWSVLFAMVSVGILMFFEGKFSLLFKVTKSQLWLSALLGLINPFGYYLVLFKAYELLQAQEAGVLNYTWPVILVILSAIFLKQKIGWLSMSAIIVSFVGLLIISTKGNIFGLKFQHPTGILLAVGSAFLWATYWILNMKDTREGTSKIFLNLFFGTIYILIYMLVFSKIAIPSVKGFFGAFYIGTFEMGITFVLWMMALNYSVTTAKVSNLIFLSPFIALLFIRIFVGEKILPSTILGLALIITGILMQQMKQLKKWSTKTINQH